MLRAFAISPTRADAHGKPVTLCGELASQPIGALALVALGYRSLSLSPSAVGPVKAMLLDLDCRKAAALMEPLIDKPVGSMSDPRAASRLLPADEGFADSSRQDRHAAANRNSTRCSTRHADGGARAGQPAAAEAYVKLSREFAELGPVVDAIKAYRDVGARNRRSRRAARRRRDRPRDARDGGEPRSPRSRRSATRSSSKIRLALIPKDAMDERNVILEIRAGTGGDEASLFAGDLFRMYERYAAKQGWKVEVVSASEGSMGGYKEIIAEVKGRGAFAKLKFESGVHRVQRVPDTEGSGRIHTSAATVAVLPEAEEVDVDDQRCAISRSTRCARSGAGGQHVNKTESAIRITHLPTGIVVMMQEDRSQHRNRAKAMAVLRTRLYDHERQKLDSARAAERRGQVGTGDRSERIRTYNFPQGRVSDHRINLTLYKLPQIIEGEALGEIIDALVTEHQAELLAAEDA